MKKTNGTAFKKPPNQYRGMPFWSWNGFLCRERLCEQVKAFKEMGFGGFYMHPRSGMETAYLTEDFFDRIEDCVTEAKNLGLKAGLYDEDRWPSGFAGGLVTANPVFRQRKLYISDNDSILKGVEHNKEIALCDGKPYIVGCYDVELDNNAYLLHYKSIGINECATHKKYYAVCKADSPSGRYNNATAVDYLQPQAIERFIYLTHRKYYERFGNEYGETIPTIFSDEPRFGPVELSNNLSDKPAVYYWTYDFPDSFKNKYGYDIVEHLPKLIWDEKNCCSFERYDFFNHISERFQDAFFKQIHAVTKSQGLDFCGHLMKEEDLFPQLCWGGDIMRMYRYFDIPGIDMLFDAREFLTAKQTQSIVRQYGKKAMLSELYGVTGWDFDFTCLKMQGDWQAVMGVSHRVPHLAMYSMKGCAKRDYPASFNLQSPWFKEFSFLEDHYARINVAFEDSTDIVNVAVIHPLESIMLTACPNSESEEYREFAEKDIQQLLETLLYNGCDFDFLNESDMQEQTVAVGKKLTVGKMSYSVIIIPPVKTLRSSTIKILEEFSENGGKVIFTGACPEYIDGRKSDFAKKLYNNSETENDKSNLLHILEPYRIVKITSNDLKNTKICRLAKDEEGYWLLIARAEKFGKTSPIRKCTEPEKVKIEIDGTFGVTVYNTLTGETEQAEYKNENGKTFVYRDWYIADSLLLRLKSYKAESKKAFSDGEKFETLYLESATYRLCEPNCAVLDICSVAVAGEEYNEPRTVFEQNSLISKKLWIYPTEVQPYAVKNSKTADVSVRFEFICKEPIAGIFLALERANECKIKFNGRDIPNVTTGFYVDRDIETIALPETNEGKNIITVLLPFTEVRQIEPCYLVGDFLTEIDELTIFLKKRKSERISFGSITEQGLHFYGGNIIYQTEFVSRECEAEIIVPNFSAHCIRIYLDGEDLGLIALSPFTIRAPLSKGKHIIAFLCYGNRNNTFGPIHNKRISDPDNYIGPWSWSIHDAEFTHEYCLQKTGILSRPFIKFR